MPRAFDARERATIERALKQAALDAMQAGAMRTCSVARLCRAAGISKGAFYGFYANKEALVVAVLREAETELRQTLDGLLTAPDPLRAVLEQIFAAVVEHPMLALLAHPDDFLWLTRALDPAVLEAARADDRAWFGGLGDRLVAEEALDPALAADRFAEIPSVALALAQAPEPLSPEARALVIDALVQRLRPVRG